MTIMKAHFIKSDNKLSEEVHEIDVNALPWDQIKKFVEGDVEFVSVLYNGKAAHMIVNEMGAVIGLPVNWKATDIYHENVKLRCADMGREYVRDHYNYIYGNVVVFEGRLP